MSNEGGGTFPRLDPTRPAKLDKSKQGRSDMKRAMYSILTVFVLVGLTGCMTQRGQSPTTYVGESCAQDSENCQSCDDPGEEYCSDPGRPVRCRMCRDRGCRQCCEESFTPGPAAGAITYPYYTVRGPRDFFADNPPSIGP